MKNRSAAIIILSVPVSVCLYISLSGSVDIYHSFDAHLTRKPLVQISGCSWGTEECKER